MFFRKLSLLFALSLFALESMAQHTQVIRGAVLDAQNLSPVKFAVIRLNNDGQTTQSDSLGHFIFRRVPVGRHEISVSSAGYASQTIKELLLESSKELIIDITLSPSLTHLPEVQVKAASPNLSGAMTSLQNITIEQVQRFPAAFMDPARLAFAFAGVANTNDQANGMAIRGNSPNGMQWRLEGVEIVNPNHLSNAGTFGDRATQTGGGTNILSAQLLGSMNFLSGAFPAEYGNAISGVMDMRFRKGNNKAYEHTLQAGLIGVDLSSEGPLNPSKGSSYLVNYRYSFTGLLALMGVNFGGEAISFQDLSFNFSLPSGKLGEISLFAMGGNSSNVFKPESDDPTDWESEKDLQHITFKSRMGVAGITQTKNFGSDWRIRNVLAFSGLENTRYSTGLKTYAEFDSTIKRRLSYSGTIQGKLSSTTTLKAGVFLTHQYDRFNTNSIPSAFDYSGFVIEPFVTVSGSFGTRISVNAGLHQINYTYNKASSLEPRLSAGYRLSSRQRLNLSYGLHSQNPATSVLYLADRIKPIRSHHFVIQHQIDFHDGAYFRAEAYLQHLFDIPKPYNLLSSIPNHSYYSTVNDIEVIAFNRPFTFENSEKGRNFGIEFTYQKYLSGSFFTLINTTLYKSQFKAFDHQYYETRFSGNHTTNITLGKEWSRNKSRILGINGRLVWRGGFRDYQIDLTRSVAANTTVFDYSQPLTVKQADYIRPDLRIYFKRSKDKYSRTLSIDLQNVIGYKNIAFTYFDSLKQELITRYQMGMVPMLNYRIEF